MAVWVEIENPTYENLLSVAQRIGFGSVAELLTAFADR